jgi:hypothetical protein
VTPPDPPELRRNGPSRALVVVATLSLAAVVVLSVLLAKREPNAATQPPPNTTQIALDSALQAASGVYTSNAKSFPPGQTLLGELTERAPTLSFAFGPQSVPSSNFASGPLQAEGISVAVSQDGQVIMFAAQASDGTCWYATSNHEKDATSAGLDGGANTRGTSYASAGGQQSCSAGNGLPTGVTAWKSSWPTT